MNNVESDTAVKHRLEVMHGDIVSSIRDGELSDSEIGRAIAFEQAIRLLEKAESGESLTPVGESPDPDLMRELIDESRKYREERR